MFFFQTRPQPVVVKIQNQHGYKTMFGVTIIAILVCMFIVSQIINLIHGGYQFSTTIINSTLIEPTVQLYQTVKLFLAPYLFHLSCYMGGDFSWDQCLEASAYFPFEFLKTCRNYQLQPQQCWDLMQLFPQDYLHDCINTHGKPYCLKLLQLLTL